MYTKFKKFGASKPTEFEIAVAAFYDANVTYYIHQVTKNGLVIHKKATASPDSPFGQTTGLYKYSRLAVLPRTL